MMRLYAYHRGTGTYIDLSDGVSLIAAFPANDDIVVDTLDTGDIDATNVFAYVANVDHAVMISLQNDIIAACNVQES